MSVRHIHAKPGQYIAVHRHRGSGGGTDAGCAQILGIGLLIVVIVSLWKIIVGLAVLAAAGWLIWTFRHAIWSGVCRLFRSIGDLIGACRRRIRNRRAAKRLPHGGALNLNCYYADYGKIRQHRR